MRERLKWMTVILITLFGAYFRFRGLGDEPFWMDEALFGFGVKMGWTQEWLPMWIGQLLGLGSDVGLRMISVVAGSLTVPAVYLVTRRWQAAVFVAVFPLFVFWSRMARPYAVAGLFMVLSWRWWWAQIPAILSTPIAIVGITKSSAKRVLFLAGLTVAVYFLRDDYARHWTIQNALASSRWFYLPSLVGVLWVCRYFEPRECPKSKGREMVFW